MFKKILVPVDIDYPDTAALVYKKANAIAKLSSAEVRLVTVMPGFSMPLVASVIPENFRQAAIQQVTAAVEKFVTEHCDPSVSYRIRTGKNWEEIIQVAERWGADLIVVYHDHRRQVCEVFSQSCSQKVSDQANCSVLRLRKIRL